MLATEPIWLTFLGLRVLSSPINQTLSEIAKVESIHGDSIEELLGEITSGIPSWIHDCRRFGISKCFIGYVCFWYGSPALEMPIS